MLFRSGCDDVEGELLAGIRAQVGSRIPLVVSLDLHANVTKRMVELADAIIGFRTFPHTDFAETGERAAELMFSMLEQGLRPHMALQKLPMIVPAENSQSSHGPFYELLTAAEHGVREGASLYTSLFPVQPWLDIEEMGSAVLVVGKDAVLAAAEAERVAAMFWEKRQDFAIQLHAVEEVLDDLARIRSSGDSQPIIASDSADSPSAGATGDSNVVLRELLRLGAHHRYRCYVMMVDAPAVAKATQAGEGEIVELEVGFTLNHAARYAEKLKLCGRVRRLGDGTFTLQGGYAKHTKAKMGRYAVVDVGSVSVLLTEKPTFSSDPGMYRSVGLEPTEADFVLVKSANQFRQDYEPISRHIYVLNTPGCSPADVKRLTYRKLEHPFYPFEDDFDWRNRE